jgi:hypothetical protein
MPETATYDPTGLIAGDFPIKHTAVTIVSGAAVVRGAVLGIITASGKYKLSTSAASDGSQVPVAIAAEAIDASGADAVGPVYHTVEFNAAQLTFGAGHNAATVEASLRGRGQSLFLVTLG